MVIVRLLPGEIIGFGDRSRQLAEIEDDLVKLCLCELDATGSQSLCPIHPTVRFRIAGRLLPVVFDGAQLS